MSNHALYMIITTLACLSGSLCYALLNVWRDAGAAPTQNEKVTSSEWEKLVADNAEAQEMLMLYTRHVFQTDINRMVNGSLFYADGEWKQGEVSGTWVIPTDAQSLAIALQERAEWQSTQTTSH
jgi:hypothetical protein